MTKAKIVGREMAMGGAENWSRDIRQALGSITVESFKRGSYSYTSMFVSDYTYKKKKQKY